MTDAPLPTDRDTLLKRLADTTDTDVVVVGGGATGLGTALEAAARGLRVVLLEADDFAKGTSSRATKLVHGGVRYLAQGNLSLVREALHERATLLCNAPHLVSRLAFVVPAYRWWDTAFYGAGLALYDRLAGRDALGRTRRLERSDTLRELPGVRADGLRGGVMYWDAQFDDARLALALARTAAALGVLVLNHVEVEDLLHSNGRVDGVVARDRERGARHLVRARVIVNATGVWVDGLRARDGIATQHPSAPIVAPSQGVHLVVDRSFLPGTHALLRPSTADGRVLFAVPWLGRTLLGTTDTPRDDLPTEPSPFAAEVDFVLREAGRCLARAPTRSDVTSAWVGLRPLVRPASDSAADTKRLSREHTVEVSKSGLVSVTGGKWTTYRAMAEDVLDACVDARLLPAGRKGETASIRLIGAGGPCRPLTEPPGPHLYGDEAPLLERLPGADRVLEPGLTEAMVRFAARHEWARSVEDVLARRSRLLFLDARRAAQIAPGVAAVLAQETGVDPGLDAFIELARRYATLPA